ncbi:hypothetical protein K8R42_02030 [bacterium]|nr:hypothetical protein [bacterium]
MNKLLKPIFLTVLLIIIISGCTLQNSKTYNIGDSIEVCPKFTSLPANKDSVHFLMKMLNSDKLDSGITWTSSNSDIKECYNLSKMKWDLSFSSLGTDYDMNFYDTIQSGEYLLKVKIAILEDGGEYSFVQAEDIKIIIK